MISTRESSILNLASHEDHSHPNLARPETLTNDGVAATMGGWRLGRSKKPSTAM
jgi:hypothetical protein